MYREVKLFKKKKKKKENLALGRFSKTVKHKIKMNKHYATIRLYSIWDTMNKAKLLVYIETLYFCDAMEVKRGGICPLFQ